MHLDLIQVISLAGKPDVPNDDRVGCGERHAWVLDGATDLGEPGLVGERGGAAWLAGKAHLAFGGAGGPLAQICGGVFDAVCAAFANERRREPVAEWELPSAAFAAVAIEEDEIACAFAADCVAIHRREAGAAYLTPPPNRTAERADAASLGSEAMASGLLSPAVLMDRRAARQRPRKVLGVDAGRSHSSTGYSRAPVARGDDILLMSDGFAALIDTYEAYDAASLAAAVRDRGLAALAEELRAIERADAACIRYPRFKRSDDASAIWLRVG